MGDRHSSVADDDMAALSKEEEVHHREGTPSSIESTPEQEAGPEVSQEPAQPQKRKGGRKPIYATSEERKQRNRQAQAAFRERRPEYIKQLEATIKQNEESLSNLQQSHRTAADECLMLRYKNSLLERILLEKGIDVQAELQIKTGSPLLGSGFMPPGPTVPHAHTPQPALQRTAVQRQQARRSGDIGFLPKLAPGGLNQDMSLFPTSSPQGHPTPSSHASSPTNVQTRSPLAMHQGGMTPPTSAVLAQPQPQTQQYQSFPRSLQQQQPPNQAFYPAQQHSPRRFAAAHHQSTASSHSTASQHSSMNPALGGGSAGPSAYYPSPFQKHIDQLEQEYDTQESRSMLDGPEDDNIPTSNGPAVYAAPQFDARQQQPSHDYYQHAISAQQQMTSQPQYQQGGQMIAPQQSVGVDGMTGFEAMSQGIDPNDPMLDADPFGLSASMHYPTRYTAMDQQPRQR